MHKKKIIFLLLLLFVTTIFINFQFNKEGFNSDYPQSNYVPSTDSPIPTAMDGTAYLSPNSNGDCPKGFQRNINDPESLCHGGCKEGKFYKVDDNIYGCVKLNQKYPQIKYQDYLLAYDKKTYYVSPTTEATCPKIFNLDTTTGLCHTKCKNDEKFYGEIGCAKLNTAYSQTQYDGSDNPYPLAQDSITNFVSPTSMALCPKGFSLDYSSGLCHNKCPPGKKFNGEVSGSSIIGCN